MVSAWTHENRLVIGQVKDTDHSKAITTAIHEKETEHLLSEKEISETA